MISCALSLQSRSLRYPRGNQMPNSSLTIFARFYTYCVSVMSLSAVAQKPGLR